MIPVIAPWRSGEHHTIPSDQRTSSRSSMTLGCESGASSGRGNPEGLKIRTSAPMAVSNLAASSVASRLYERSRTEPYSIRIRGGWGIAGTWNLASVMEVSNRPASTFLSSVGILFSDVVIGIVQSICACATFFRQKGNQRTKFFIAGMAIQSSSLTFLTNQRY